MYTTFRRVLYKPAVLLRMTPSIAYTRPSPPSAGEDSNTSAKRMNNSLTCGEDVLLAPYLAASANVMPWKGASVTNSVPSSFATASDVKSASVYRFLKTFLGVGTAVRVLGGTKTAGVLTAIAFFTAGSLRVSVKSDTLIWRTISKCFLDSSYMSRYSGSPAKISTSALYVNSAFFSAISIRFSNVLALDRSAYISTRYATLPSAPSTMKVRWFL